MPRPSINVTKCHINLYTEDKQFLEKKFGAGWTSEVRDIVRLYCASQRIEAHKRQTIEDMIRENGYD